MSEPHTHAALTFVADLGHATACIGYGTHRPKPLRFVWHHVLPQVCGGRTLAANLASLCDGCHYSIHALMYLLATHGGDATVIRHLGSRQQRAIALDGYSRAVAAGTADKIPNEGLPTAA